MIPLSLDFALSLGHGGTASGFYLSALVRRRQAESTDVLFYKRLKQSCRFITAPGAAKAPSANPTSPTEYQCKKLQHSVFCPTYPKPYLCS